MLLDQIKRGIVLTVIDRMDIHRHVREKVKNIRASKKRRNDTVMKLFICPKCGWLRTVSRRTKVECYRCGRKQMEPVKLTYDRYVKMTQKERDNYKDSWLYIHSRSTKNKLS